MEQRVKIRSTGRLSAKKMLPLREMLESSQTLYDYDRQRARPYGELKFSAVDMMIICLFMEIKKLTFEGLTEALDGRGGQVVLKNLGMPKGKNGRFQRPSNAWISTFRNHDYMYFRHELDRELRDTVLPKGRKNHVLLTCDSTPAEARGIPNGLSTTSTTRFACARSISSWQTAFLLSGMSRTETPATIRSSGSC